MSAILIALVYFSPAIALALWGAIDDAHHEPKPLDPSCRYASSGGSRNLE